MTIDLSSLAEPPRSGRRRAGVAPRSVPRGWAVACALAAALLVGASTPAAVRETAAIPVGDASTDSYALDGDALYVMRPGSVTAYTAAGGAPRWSVTGAAYRYERGYGRVAVLSAGACAGPADPADGVRPRTAGYDKATGHPLWQRDGTMLVSIHSAGDSADASGDAPLVVLLGDGPTDRCTAPNGNVPLTGTLRVAGLDPATGVPAWQVDLPRGSTISFDRAAPRWMGTADPRGDLSVIDLRSGIRTRIDTGVRSNSLQLIAIGGAIVLAQSNVPRTRQITSSTESDAQIIPSYTVEDDPGPPQVAITGYDGRTLARLWQTTVADRPGGLLSRRCGGNLCVVGEQTVAVDPRDGRVAWTAAPADYADLGGGRLMADPSSDYQTGTADQEITLVDPATGRRMLRLPAWHPIAVDGDRLLIGQTDRAGTRTVLAWLVGRRPEPFAVVAAAVDEAMLAGSTLAYRSGGGIHLVHLR